MINKIHYSSNPELVSQPKEILKKQDPEVTQKVMLENG